MSVAVGEIAVLLGFALTGWVLSLLFSDRITNPIAVFLVEKLPRWWLGDHRIKVVVSFDRGDAAMKAGDPAKAVALYRAELDRHPDDPDLFLRIAEAYRKLKDPVQASANLRHAARTASDPERKGSISLLLADELKAAGDREGAEAVLRSVLGDPALSRFHPGARTRLQRP